MAALIDGTMAENQGKGISGALDATFQALAENAGTLSDDETGVLKVSGRQMVGMTMDALGSSFGGSDAQLMGAIGAAALRA